MEAACCAFTRAWDAGERPTVSAYLDRVPDVDRPLLLRNLLESDVRRRRANGQAPTVSDYGHQLPAGYADLVRRVFLDASSVSVSAAHDPTRDGPPRPDAPVASRLGEYRLVREIGRGGMGAVFEAVHLGRGHRVALKTLPAVSGDSLHRFKREFRALSHVTHPNLVGLRTLESDGSQWFLTLDLIDGCEFRAFVRPGGRRDLPRLRAAVAQLVTGVMALHARGVVHRDLKPGNVLVTPTGQVIILDFGLVAELGLAASMAAGGVAGTPAYMAPEQAAGGDVGPPSDWYAVGVMLYEGLCGRRPFDGDPWRVMRDKRERDAPPLPTDPDTPADLADLSELCGKLLARDPADRPDPLAIAGAVSVAAPTSVGPPGAADQLVGRESQRAELAEALATFRRTRSPVTVFVRGRSGEGKTRLAEAFLTPLRADPSLVVLSGRCYDRESVPFKALDTVVDALAAHLRGRPDAAALLPDDIGILAELFPVLRRCEAVDRAPRGRLDALDQQQVRRRAFAALRDLLARIGAGTPLVWFIDDLQWGDADSAGAVFEVLRPPAAPPVLLLGSYRSDEADTSPFLTEWAEQQRQAAVDFGDRSVTVGPLPLDPATRLVANVVGRDDEVVRRRAVQFHAQTGGNPFLLTELAGCFDPDADAFHATDIHGVLARKLAGLGADAGPLLEAVSVSGQAVELSEAAAAGGVAEAEAVLTRMRNLRLLRVVGDKVDTYHDRIRYAVLDRLADGPKRAMHRRLAEVIERTAGGLTDGEIAAVAGGTDGDGRREALGRVYDLSYHWDAAGVGERALAYALTAARQARGQYALDVAAQQYAVAERNAADAPKAVRFAIARGRGEAVMMLGRYHEAGGHLEAAQAVAHTPYATADAVGLRGELASKLGFIDDSVAHFEAALRVLGTRVPRSRSGFVWGLVKGVAGHLLNRCLPSRLLQQPAERTQDLTNQLLAKLEWSYYCHDVVKLLWASFVGLNRAERLPPSKALAINYVVHANDLAVLGWHARAEKYYRMAGELFRELNDQWGEALALSHSSHGCLASARYELALARAEPGKVSFEKLGDRLEHHFTYSFFAMGHYALGNLAESYAQARWLFDSCVRHGDNWLGAWALYYMSRSVRGHLPFDELIGCVRNLPGNTLSASTAAMAEGYWHSRHGRTGEAVTAFERAWERCRSRTHVTPFNSNVLGDLATALRRHAEALDRTAPNAAGQVWQRAHRMARWSVRLSWLYPTERAPALREWALVHAHKGRIRKGWELAAKSCRIAIEQKAKYEHAQSLLVLGQLGRRLGKPEAYAQIRDAEAEIARIEGELDRVLATPQR